MNDDTARQLLSRLRRLQDTTRLGKPFMLPPNCVSRLDLTERRLLDALRRDNTGSPARDGHGSGRPGSGGDDAGSSVETAAIANVDNLHPTRDPIHDLTVLATNHLEQAVTSIAGLLTALDDIDRISNPAASRPDPAGTCLICARHVEGTSNDRLRRGMCDTDYRAWLDAGRPDLTEFRRTRTEAA